jgi:hypothetical protein
LSPDLIFSNEYENPALHGGVFCWFLQSKKGGKFPPSASFYQLRKQWRPNGPRCQPGPQPPATGMVAVSAAAAWSSGATGIALDAEIDARPRPIANKDTAIIFMDIPFYGLR